MKTKLTLSINKDIIKKAKKKVIDKETSVSQIVEEFLRQYING